MMETNAGIPDRSSESEDGLPSGQSDFVWANPVAPGLALHARPMYAQWHNTDHRQEAPEIRVVDGGLVVIDLKARQRSCARPPARRRGAGRPGARRRASSRSSPDPDPDSDLDDGPTARPRMAAMTARIVRPAWVEFRHAIVDALWATDKERGQREASRP